MAGGFALNVTMREPLFKAFWRFGHMEEFEVARIRAYRWRDGIREYLVHWKGYAYDEDTWECEENLKCDLLIDEFWRSFSRGKGADVSKLEIIGSTRKDGQIVYEARYCHGNTEILTQEFLEKHYPKELTRFLLD